MATTMSASEVPATQAQELRVPSPAALRFARFKLLIIEGNISAGKSTIAESLARTTGYRLFLEPTNTNPYLEKFYADPVAYALRMQLWLLRQRYVTYVAALRHVLETGDGVILDRSVFSDWVFAAKNRHDGNISEAGYQYYMRLRERLMADLPVPHVTLYLDVAPERCFSRVHDMRARESEKGIPLAYLAGLDACYGKFLDRMHAVGSRVLRIDWNAFGTLETVIGRMAELHDSQAGDGCHEFNERLRKARALLYDDAAVQRRMTMAPEAGVDDDGVLPTIATDCTVEESYTKATPLAVKGTALGAEPSPCTIDAFATPKRAQRRLYGGGDDVDVDVDDDDDDRSHSSDFAASDDVSMSGAASDSDDGDVRMSPSA